MPPRSILAKSVSAFRFTPRKCAGVFRTPKGGFCYCKKKHSGVQDGWKMQIWAVFEGIKCDLNT